MKDDAAITSAFWDHLRADRTVMLGLDNFTPPGLRPMTALPDSDADGGPIWFFTSTDSAIVQGMALREQAVFTFTSTGHELFATVHGVLTQSLDTDVIDRLWSPMIAAWYAGGKSDPTLVLLRFDPARAEIWRDASSLLDGLKLLFGGIPHEADKGDRARVSLA